MICDSLKIFAEACLDWSEKTSIVIERLIDVASRLDFQNSFKSLKNLRTKLESERFLVVVVGGFMVGKSTLANALLNPPLKPVPEFQDNLGPLLSGWLPSTAVLTRVQYADDPYVYVWKSNGQKDTWSLARYLHYLEAEEDRELLKDIREFEVFYPSELCKAGITLIDTPGFNDLTDTPGFDDTPGSTERILQIVQESDVAFVLFRGDALCGLEEREFLLEIITTETPLFRIVNLFNKDIIADRYRSERFKHYAWRRLVEEMGGPEYNGQNYQDFATQNVYFVNCNQAFQDRQSENEAMSADSGLNSLVEGLVTFLIGDRLLARHQMYMKEAMAIIEPIKQQLNQDTAEIEQAQQQLQQTFMKLALDKVKEDSYGCLSNR